MMSSKQELKLKKWRHNYAAGQKREKRKNFLMTLAAIATIAVSSFLFYSWSTDELQFIGRETAVVNAVVVDKKGDTLG